LSGFVPMDSNRSIKHGFAALFLGVTLCASPAGAQEKVILDSDYTTIGYDGQVGVTAMQLHAQGVINLLGITVVAGNQWLPQEVSDALKAVERMGLTDTVGVYAGARYPLVHDYKTMTYERDLYNVGGSWYLSIAKTRNKRHLIDFL
jgi:inosine-uridine nucleoside N-ribohydrolase